MPFGYLEFSRAIGRKPCPRAPALVSGQIRIPGPVLFEPGLTGMSNGYQPTAVDSWAVAAVETNRYNGSDRTVATVRLGSDPFTPPGAL